MDGSKDTYLINALFVIFCSCCRCRCCYLLVFIENKQKKKKSQKTSASGAHLVDAPLEERTAHFDEHHLADLLGRLLGLQAALDHARDLVEKAEDDLGPELGELLALYVVDVDLAERELVERVDEVVDGLLTQQHVGVLDVRAVGRVVPFEVELVAQVVDRVENSLQDLVVLLLGLGKPALLALVDDEHGVVLGLLLHDLVLEDAYELIGLVGQSSLLEHVHDAVDLVVHLVHRFAHPLENVLGAELVGAEADRVDDGEVLVGAHVELDVARARVLAHRERTADDLLQIAALIEQAIAHCRLANTRYAHNEQLLGLWLTRHRHRLQQSRRH